MKPERQLSGSPSYAVAPDIFHKRNFRLLLELNPRHHSGKFLLADIQDLCNVSDHEAEGTVRWAIFHGLMSLERSDCGNSAIYRFSDYGLRNGMTIEVNQDAVERDIPDFGIKGKRFLHQCLEAERTIQLDSSLFRKSGVIGDGRIMIKGVGFFPQAYFRQHKPSKSPSLPLYLVEDAEGRTLPAYWKNDAWVHFHDSSVSFAAEVTKVLGKVTPCEEPSRSQ